VQGRAVVDARRCNGTRACDALVTVGSTALASGVVGSTALASAIDEAARASGVERRAALDARASPRMLRASPMSARIYLDHNAGAPLLPEARRAMLEALELWGNPSSLHHEGRAARQVVERARNQLAALLGAPREELVLTSGGTEADQLGIIGLAQRAARQGRPRRVAGSRIEHPAIRGAVSYLVRERGWERLELPVSAEGALQLPEEAQLAATPIGLVAAAWVNHELGTMQDVAALAAWARRAGALCFVDAVQAAGKAPLAPLCAAAPASLGAGGSGDGAAAVDGVAISSHKLGGPKGAGCVWLRADPAEALPVFEGGHQERGRRPGTENPVAIAGFGAAAAVASAALAAEPEPWAGVRALGERLERGLAALPDTRIHGRGAPRLGGTINAGFAGARGESLVMALDLAGIAAATGAACSSGSVQPSPVLLALGLSPAQAKEAVRFSLGRTTTAAEIDAVLAALPALLERARRFA
jgi:cysteine desulfurase